MEPSAPEPSKPLSNYTPQSDPSKLIRTYAKDVAALGHAGDVNIATPSAPIVKETEKAKITESGVTMPEYDTSPVERPGASPKEFPQEIVDLKESDSEGIFTATKSPDAVPEPAPEPDRELILARLRAKVATERSAAISMPPASEPPIRTAAPDFAAIAEPALPIPQVSKEPVPPPSAPPPTPALESPPAPQPLAPPSPIHTYSSDFSDHIDTAGATTFSVLAAQSDAGQTPARVPQKRSFAPLIAGLAMLVIGVGAVAGAYLFTRQGSVAPAAANVPSLIPFDESVHVQGTGQSLMQAISDVGQGGSVQGNVVVTYVTLATSSGSGIPQPGGVLIQDLGLSMPSILARNIDESSTVGIVRAGAESRPFMVLKVNSYERTFAGMLAWEPTMATDLQIFYPSYSDMGTTSSTTAPQTSASASFTDAVVSNYDVRVLRDSAGRSLMLYGYRGKDTLIIARDEAAFSALVARLSAAGN